MADKYLTCNTVISHSGSGGTGSFIRISDKKPGEPLPDNEDDHNEIAEIIDRITEGFEVDESASESYFEGFSNFLKEKYPGPEGVHDLAAEFGLECPSEIQLTGKKTVKVYVHASSQEILDNYDIVSYGSVLEGPVIEEGVIDDFVEFENSTSIPFEYFVTSNVYNIKWSGVADSKGRAVGIPDHTVIPGRILLHTPKTGSVKITGVKIKYHVWTVTLTGIQAGDQRLYAGRASVVAPAYNLGPEHQKLGGDLIDDLSENCPFSEYSIPDSSSLGSCFIQVERELRKQCTNDLVEDLPTVYNPAPCPRPDMAMQWNNPASFRYNKALPEYYRIVGHAKETLFTFEGTSPAIDAEEYSDACCHPPVTDSCIPYCRQINSVFNGPVEIDGGEQKYIDEYAGKTVFIPVTTKSGVCGTITDKFVDPGGSCCNNVPALVWVQVQEKIQPNGNLQLQVTGGDYSNFPILWTIESGDGYSFANGQLQVSGGTIVTLYANEAPCGPAYINADDGCSEASGYVYPDVIDITVDPGGITPGSSDVYACTSGQSTVTWRITGVGVDEVWFAGNVQEITYTNDYTVRVYTAADLRDLCVGKTAILSVEDACGSDETDIVFPAAADIEIIDPLTEITPGTSEVFTCSNGRSTVTWRITGVSVDEAWFAGNVQEITYVNDYTVRVYAAASLRDLCVGKTAILSVEDNCGADDTAIVFPVAPPIDITVDPGGITPGSSDVYACTSGQSTVTWRITGVSVDEVWFANGTQEITYVNDYTVRVYAAAGLRDLCVGKTAVLSVEDNCGSDNTDIVFPAVADLEIPTGPNTIEHNASAVYVASGGQATITWRLSGAPASQVYFAGGGQVISYTNDLSVRVYTSADGPLQDPVTLSVEDGCSVSSRQIYIV